MENLAAFFLTGAISLGVGLVLRSLEPRSKLVYWQPHFARFVVPLDGSSNSVTLQSDAITIQNLGRKSAERIELVFPKKPDFFQLAPGIPYSEHVLPDDSFVLKIESLGPKEFFTLQILSYATVPVLALVRCVAGSAEQMPFQMQRQFPKWIIWGIQFLLWVGTAFTLYWLVRAVVLISSQINIL